jgi:site-specific DNA-methyltransferase (adenine-specific)
MRKTNETKAGRNRTLFLTPEDEIRLEKKLLMNISTSNINNIINKTINANLFDVIDSIPSNSVDLLIADPPYNLTKEFNNNKFNSCSMEEYSEWLEFWISKLPRILKSNASLYICGDWRSSPALYFVLKKYFVIQNRITWEREKGRGSLKNWKNSHEDIWFCTMSNDYIFNIDSIKLKKKVIAPYRENGKPKDWAEEEDGRFRLTHPSNMMSDLTVPFWSMPENTDHPTQKPEKLIARLILASSNSGDVVFDPFLGSGTTSVVAKKLNRKYIGVELEKLFSLLAEKRLELADIDNSIQGYSNGVFWERNSLSEQKKTSNSSTIGEAKQTVLFAV